MTMIADVLSATRALEAGELARAEQLSTLLLSRRGASPRAEDRLAGAFGLALLARMRGSTQDSGNLYAQGPGPEEMLAAYDLLLRRTPFVRFGRAATNTAILHVLGAAPSLHVLDIGIGWGGQWTDMIRRLAALGPAAPALHLTGVELPTLGPDPQAQLRAVGQRLGAEAQALGLRFSFEGIASPVEELEQLPEVPGALLVVNAALALHHVSDQAGSSQRDALLRRLADLRPALFTLVEPEADHNQRPLGPRVAAALQHYGAIFSALEVLCADEERSREIIEQDFFGREILNVVAAEGEDRVERHEPMVAWIRRLRRAGFAPSQQLPTADVLVPEVPLPEGALLVARPGGMSLCWQGQPILNLMALVPVR